MKRDKCAGLMLTDVWPVRTDIYPNGGIGVYWHGDIGVGEFVLFWDGEKLHARTETLDSNEDKRFTREILRLLADEIVIDE